jgi:hypothetical protein
MEANKKGGIGRGPILGTSVLVIVNKNQTRTKFEFKNQKHELEPVFIFLKNWTHNQESNSI